MYGDAMTDQQTLMQVLAVVMAQMSGYKDLPKHKSILGQQEGFVTLGLRHTTGRGFISAGALCGTVRTFTNADIAGQIGKVELFDDSEDTGFDAAFDVPANIMATIIAGAPAKLLRFLNGLDRRR